MAEVVWSAGIDHVSGALAKPTKSGQHSCQKMLLGTHRVAATTSPDCNRLYLRKKVKRTSTPSTNELEARNRFAEVGAMVRTRAKDLTKITTDQAAFLAQKDSATGKKTLKAYLWKVCGDEWDDQNG